MPVVPFVLTGITIVLVIVVTWFFATTSALVANALPLVVLVFSASLLWAIFCGIGWLVNRASYRALQLLLCCSLVLLIGYPLWVLVNGGMGLGVAVVRYLLAILLAWSIVTPVSAAGAALVIFTFTLVRKRMTERPIRKQTIWKIPRLARSK